jgi:hypothetical protein
MLVFFKKINMKKDEFLKNCSVFKIKYKNVLILKYFSFWDKKETKSKENKK